MYVCSFLYHRRISTAQVSFAILAFTELGHTDVEDSSLSYEFGDFVPR